MSKTTAVALLAIALEPSGFDIFDHHVRSAEPLTEDDVNQITAEDVEKADAFEERGGGLYWHAETFPLDETQL